MSSLPRKLALAVAAVLLLASCGGSEDSSDSTAPTSGDSSASSSEAPSNNGSDRPDQPDQPDRGDRPDDGGTVTREAFCDDIDRQAVADLLGLDQAEIIAEYAPDDEISTGTDTAPIVSPSWTCTIGTTADGGIGATWNVGNVDATPKDVAGTLQRQTLALGKDKCTDSEDDLLGAGTRGIDCSGSVGEQSFTLAARSAVVDGTQIDCSVASTAGDDLGTLVAALPELCALFVDTVVEP